MQGLNLNPNAHDPHIPKVELPAGASVPHLSPKMKLEPTGFWTNLKDFLTERSIKLPKNGHEAFRVDGLEDSVFDNFKALFHVGPKIAGDAGSAMAVEWQPGYKVFFRNLRDLISPPKLPPLKITSKPVAVRSLWARREKFGTSQIISLAVHVTMGVLLLVIGRRIVESKPPDTTTAVTLLTDDSLSPYKSKLPAGPTKASGGGGGGERQPLPPTRGKLPKFSMQQLAPPMATVRNTAPQLSVEPTLLGPPDLKLPSPNMDNFGDPLSKFNTGSGGPGSGGGIGTGSGGGIGSGNGGGLGPGSGGGTGGGAFRAGVGGVGNASCIYCPTPEYSEDARKAKFQGTVILEVTVQTDGHATDIRVVKGPGLGLDEKAIEAVKTWRFKPALGPTGTAVASVNSIEVTFRLL